MMKRRGGLFLPFLTFAHVWKATHTCDSLLPYGTSTFGHIWFLSGLRKHSGLYNSSLNNMELDRFKEKKNLAKWGIVAYICNLSSREAKAGGFLQI